MTPINPRMSTCTACKAKIRIPDDAKPGHRLICTHCGARYTAWQLLARAQRRLEEQSDEG